MHRLGFVVIALSLTVGVTAWGVAGIGRPTVEVSVTSTELPPIAQRAGRDRRAVAVLHRWDRRRSAAWSAADPAAVRRLYVSGSRTGRRDVRMLEEYAERGLRVTGLCTQLLAVDVVHAGPRRLRLVVTDRVCGGSVEGAGLDHRLPADSADRHVVDLVRGQDRWLVSEVRSRARPRSPRGRRRRGTCSPPASALPGHPASSRGPPAPSGRPPP